MTIKASPTIVEYRVQQLELAVEKISSSINEMNKSLTAILTQLSVLESKLDSLDKQVEDHSAENDTVKEQVNDLKVSLAERIGPGALSGAIISVLAEIIKYITS